MSTTGKQTKEISLTSAWISIAGAIACLLFLAILHIISPEFDPSWRMVSEYALGRYGWVLSLMFLSWAVSSWALAVGIWPQVKTKSGKIGLYFLIIAGLGEAMASVFDIRYDIMHNLAGLLGIGGLPVAALLISASLSHNQRWATKALLWTANLTWVSIVLMVATLVIMTIQFAQVNGGQLPKQAPKVLPAGVLGLDGWANRLLIVIYCVWVATIARQAIRIRNQKSS